MRSRRTQGPTSTVARGGRGPGPRGRRRERGAAVLLAALLAPGAAGAQSPARGVARAAPPPTPTGPAEAAPPDSSVTNPWAGAPRAPATGPRPGAPEAPAINPWAGAPEAPATAPRPGAPEAPATAPRPGAPDAPATAPRPGAPDAPATAPRPGAPDAPAANARPATPDAPATDPRPGAPDARDARQASPVDLLTLHRDTYFITGFSKGTQAKFQFSFKYELWPNAGPHAVQLGYTQRSLWALYDTSSPFTETNYAPELFYTYYHRAGRDDAPGCGFFHQRVGFEHESNGRSPPLSRSWNRLYAETRFVCRDAASRHLAAAQLRAWAPPIGTADNPAITRYLGYGELGLSYGLDARGLGNVSLSAIGRKGTSRRLALGSLEFDLRWRPAYESFAAGWRLTPHLYAQAYTGYGEMLVSYDAPTTAFRVGFGISDRPAPAR